MKKITTVLAIAVLVFSCGPKLAVTAMQPDPVQVPTKIASPQETGAVTPVGPLASNATDLEAGKSLYENKCANCHKLFKPTDFTAEEWKPIMKKMQIKAKIDDGQAANIYNYIISGLQ